MRAPSPERRAPPQDASGHPAPDPTADGRPWSHVPGRQPRWQPPVDHRSPYVRNQRARPHQTRPDDHLVSPRTRRPQPEPRRLLRFELRQIRQAAALEGLDAWGELQKLDGLAKAWQTALMTGDSRSAADRHKASDRADQLLQALAAALRRTGDLKTFETHHQRLQQLQAQVQSDQKRLDRLAEWLADEDASGDGAPLDAPPPSTSSKATEARYGASPTRTLPSTKPCAP